MFNLSIFKQMFNYRKPVSPVTVTGKEYTFNKNLKVVGGLAVTPSQMLDLTQRGIAISASNNMQYLEGSEDPSFDLPIDARRGIDVNDVWDAQTNARRKLLNANKTAQ